MLEIKRLIDIVQQLANSVRNSKRDESVTIDLHGSDGTEEDREQKVSLMYFASRIELLCFRFPHFSTMMLSTFFLKFVQLNKTVSP